LAYCFQEGPATVKKIEDFFYLGLEMESGRSDEEVRAAGETALTRINAICLGISARVRCFQKAREGRNDNKSGARADTEGSPGVDR
jgi:hypothetical protein